MYVCLEDGARRFEVDTRQDFQLRVLNYNTAEKVANFEAHPDYSMLV
jgi:hypothetical protein